MISFENDYLTGAAPEILKALSETNYIAQTGYGRDEFSDAAREKIADFCGVSPEQVFLTAAGTQTNQLVIGACMTHYEGVIAAATGHVNGHEAGAVEFTGHKVLTLPQEMGRIRPEDLKQYLEDFYKDGSWEHFAQPGMVYISHPTEYGTLYSRAQLKALREICSEYGLMLYLDGARLASALACPETDVTIRDLVEYTDAFYIGGTKCGALIGEALVFCKKETVPPMFFNTVKKFGDMLAKGRLVALNMGTLFTDGLYMKLGRRAVELAGSMEQILKKHGYRIFVESPTNQKFIVMENEALKKLEEEVRVSFWEKVDEDHTAIRLATCWSTTEEDLEELDRVLGTLE